MNLCKLLVLALSLAIGGAVRAQDVAPKPTEAARRGLEFRIVAPPGKTRWMVGETIALRLSFANRGAQTLYLNQFYRDPPTLVPLAQFAVEPQLGTRDPLAGLPAPMVLAIAGYVPPPVLLGEKPAENPFDLNQYLRFEAPGTYIVRATTTRVFAWSGTKKPSATLFLPSPNAAPAVSEPLTLEIVPADPQWQARQVEAWRALWATQEADDYSWRGRSAAGQPAGDLRYLDTRAAALAIIDRLGSTQAPRTASEEAYRWRMGLIGFSERDWLLGAMKEAMARPDYAVTGPFLETLAALQTLYHGVKVPGSMAQKAFDQNSARADLANWKQTLAALPAKAGRPRAMTLFTLIQAAWRERWAKEAPAIQARLPRLIAQVPNVFADLPPQTQEYLLYDQFNADAWPRIKSPRLAPVLARLWAQTRLEPNNSYHAFPNAILHRFYEVAPDAGRAAILSEMAAANPRASFAALSLLPDKTLPALEELWWKHLHQNGAAQDIAALLIGRYASPTLKARVQSEFARRTRDKMLSTDISTGLRRYLARVK